MLPFRHENFTLEATIINGGLFLTLRNPKLRFICSTVVDFFLGTKVVVVKKLQSESVKENMFICHLTF